MTMQTATSAHGGALVSKSGTTQASQAEYLRLADNGAMS